MGKRMWQRSCMEDLQTLRILTGRGSLSVFSRILLQASTRLDPLCLSNVDSVSFKLIDCLGQVHRNHRFGFGQCTCILFKTVALDI